MTLKINSKTITGKIMKTINKKLNKNNNNHPKTNTKMLMVLPSSVKYVMTLLPILSPLFVNTLFVSFASLNTWFILTSAHNVALVSATNDFPTIFCLTISLWSTFKSISRKRWRSFSKDSKPWKLTKRIKSTYFNFKERLNDF